MKELVLMRHGEALSALDSGAAGDAGRTLSPRGREQVERSAERLKSLGFVPDIIISSPLLRAVETADIAALLFHGAGRAKEPALASPASMNEVLNAIHSAAGKASSALVAGHQPTMGELSALLLGAPHIPLRTGSFVYLRLPSGLKTRKAELAEFFEPEPV